MLSDYGLLPITHTAEQHLDDVKFSRFEDMKANVHKVFDEELLLQHMTTLIAKNQILLQCCSKTRLAFVEG
nr:hypothetical protein CFP56_08404 [Quercus suber]